MAEHLEDSCYDPDLVFIAPFERLCRLSLSDEAVIEELVSMLPEQESDSP